jgi:hypothetical protein
MSPAEPLRPLTDEEVRAFVDDGVVCARGVMPAEWRDVVAHAIARNLAEPSFIGQVISLPDQGFLNDVFVWLHDEGFRRFVLDSPASVIAGQALAGLGATTMSFFYDQSFVKEPGTLVPTPWHHDLTFWPVEARSCARSGCRSTR